MAERNFRNVLNLHDLIFNKIEFLTSNILFSSLNNDSSGANFNFLISEIFSGQREIFFVFAEIFFVLSEIFITAEIFLIR